MRPLVWSRRAKSKLETLVGIGFPELLSIFLSFLSIFLCKFEGELGIRISYSHSYLNPDWDVYLTVLSWAEYLTSNPQFPHLKNIGTLQGHCEM